MDERSTCVQCLNEVIIEWGYTREDQIDSSRKGRRQDVETLIRQYSSPNWLIGSVSGGPFLTTVSSNAGHNDSTTDEEAGDPRYRIEHVTQSCKR